MRLARSYEELRGRDIEGFVRFIRDQEALGASQLEAVSEEEGADAVRLLTIHAREGARVQGRGRRRRGPRHRRRRRRPTRSSRAPTAASASRSSIRRRASSTASSATRRCARPGSEAERGRAAAPLLRRDDARDRPADRLRRDRRRAGRRRRSAGCSRGSSASEELAAAEAPFELERGGRDVPRHASTGARRRRPRRSAGESPTPSRASSRSSRSCRPRRRRAATGCPSSCRSPSPPLHRVRRLSYSALALFERCSYRYYAERVAGLRERRGVGAPAAIGLAATEIGDAVHRLLELVDLRDPRPPDLGDRCARGTRR